MEQQRKWMGLDARAPDDELTEPEDAHRTERRAERVRARFPRSGGFLVSVTPELPGTDTPAHAADEEACVAARLEKLCGGEAMLLHNRKQGLSAQSGDIDHIAIVRSGVYVIDARQYKGAKVTVRRTGGVLAPRREQLMIRGRDKTTRVDSLNKQFLAVTEVVDRLPVQVTALFCFIDADLPLFERLMVGGVPVLGPRTTGQLLRRPGPLGHEQRRSLWERLARALPPA